MYFLFLVCSFRSRKLIKSSHIFQQYNMKDFLTAHFKNEDAHFH